ncbi:MAG TPA: alpha-hydroxy acid oxidase [Opitutaceae bacterium]|nr:alpha-hydroxy acid oxidase [Opitutaceae bacterium]
MPPPKPADTVPPEVAAVSDYEPLACARMEPGAWAYYASGGADEITLRENRAAYDRLRLEQRVLVDFSRPGSTAVTLFGQTFEHPILLAPVAYHKLAHPEGELAVARGAAAAKAGMVVSTHATYPLEDIARAAGAPLWFQLYIKPDRGLTRELVERAERAGYRALVVTVDAPVTGVRNRQQRLHFKLPPGVAAVNLPGESPMGGYGAKPGTLAAGSLAQAPTWKDIAWLRSFTQLPILLKGVMAAEDAARAAAEGASGVVVSNHGGRALDTVPATIEALPRIAERVGGKIPLLVDGGIRRGSDVLKALALGASAVLVGRPYLHGLAVAGSAGVAHVIELLRGELEMAMILTGKKTLAEVDRTVFWRD